MKFLAFGMEMNASIEKITFYRRIALLSFDVLVFYDNCNNDDADNDKRVS